MLQGYATGIFPMAESRASDELFWVEPRQRAILPIGGFHLSRSLRRRLASGQFRVTCDADFAGVIAGCADRPETWINRPIEQAMHDLHALNAAHSVEVWLGDRLAGGIYGVKLGRAFFGESMFSRATDASKVALAWLVARLKVGGYTLLDCQFMTEHLASLGAVSVSRARYSALLATALGSGTGSAAGGGSLGAGSESGLSGAERETPPAFDALDRLLDAEGLAGADGPSGKFIAQLLTQTS